MATIWENARFPKAVLRPAQPEDSRVGSECLCLKPTPFSQTISDSAIELRGKDVMAVKHLRRRSVEEVTGLSRSTIYSLMARGEFPRPVRLTARAVAWPETDVAEWLAQRDGA